MTIGLPAALQRRMRALPPWTPVALRQAQEAVQVRMSSASAEVDVTRAAVVAALRPLTLAVGLNEQLMSSIEDRSRPQLHFVDLESRRTVGMLQLQHVRNWITSGAAIGLFEVRRGTQRCVRWPYRAWNRWLQNRSMRRNTNPHNFFMPPEAMQQQQIFYICPRPVVLVSVDDGSHSNLFPMDLIGPVSLDRFTLALRSTSQSIATMKSARRVALSDVAARDCASVYKLGIHHQNVKVEWNQLPFKIQRSRNFSLPCPAIALRIREIEILDFETVGSHTFFVTQIASEHSDGDDERLFHTSGIYQHFRSCHGRPFPSAS
jgi:flavin reductase (DIM6/NTAB) family NADH-FMN oxidoreductase RutF